MLYPNWDTTDGNNSADVDYDRIDQYIDNKISESTLDSKWTFNNGTLTTKNDVNNVEINTLNSTNATITTSNVNRENVHGLYVGSTTSPGYLSFNGKMLMNIDTTIPTTPTNESIPTTKLLNDTINSSTFWQYDDADPNNTTIESKVANVKSGTFLTNLLTIGSNQPDRYGYLRFQNLDGTSEPQYDQIDHLLTSTSTETPNNNTLPTTSWVKKYVDENASGGGGSGDSIFDVNLANKTITLKNPENYNSFVISIPSVELNPTLSTALLASYLQTNYLRVVNLKGWVQTPLLYLSGNIPSVRNEQYLSNIGFSKYIDKYYGKEPTDGNEHGIATIGLLQAAINKLKAEIAESGGSSSWVDMYKPGMTIKIDPSKTELLNELKAKFNLRLLGIYTPERQKAKYISNFFNYSSWQYCGDHLKLRLTITPALDNQPYNVTDLLANGIVLNKEIIDQIFSYVDQTVGYSPHINGPIYFELNNQNQMTKIIKQATYWFDTPGQFPPYVHNATINYARTSDTSFTIEGHYYSTPKPGDDYITNMVYTENIDIPLLLEAEPITNYLTQSYIDTSNVQCDYLILSIKTQ